MPQHIDSRFDALLEMYASTEVDRMDSCDTLRQYAYECLIEHFRDMTEKELIEHVAMEGDEELIESIYGNYPPRDVEGQYSLKKGESIVL